MYLSFGLLFFIGACTLGTWTSHGIVQAGSVGAAALCIYAICHARIGLIISSTALFLGFLRVLLPITFELATEDTLMQRFVGGRIREVVEYPESEIAGALLTGQRTTIPTATKDAFRDSGLAHLLAVSGFNVTLIANALLHVLRSRLSKKAQTTLVVIGIVVFVLGAGASAAVVRAGLMGGLGAYALHAGRPTRVMRILLVAASFMALLNPRVLLFDVGFQLSVAATGFILLFARPLSKRLTWMPNVLGLRENIATSITATIGTAPILAYTFGTLPLLGIGANVFAVPLIPTIMLTSFISACVAGSPLAIGIGTLTTVLTRALTWIASFFAQVPVLEVHTTGVLVITGITIFVSLALYIALNKRTAGKQRVSLV